MQRKLLGVVVLALLGCVPREQTNLQAQVYEPWTPVFYDLKEPSSLVSGKSYPGWERFGDWHVKEISDDMDAVTHVRLFTKLNNTSSRFGAALPADLSFGFEVFDGKLVTLSTGLEFPAKNYWAFCELDQSTISIDDSKAVVLNARRIPGSCDSVDGDGPVMRSLRMGQQARVRMAGVDGKISLVGFNDAWGRAMTLAK